MTRSEYRSAVAYMENCGILDGFTQERTAARAEYTPPFDLTGVGYRARRFFAAGKFSAIETKHFR